MLTNDLKTIIELMEIAGGKFSAVKIENFKAYATNGKALVVRDIAMRDQGFIDKSHLPMLKARYAMDKKLEETETGIGYMIANECTFSFPTTEQMDSVFNAKFEYELNFNADDLIKAIKSMKGKDNSIILKIKDNASPFLVVHENGKAIISTKKGE